MEDLRIDDPLLERIVRRPADRRADGRSGGPTGAVRRPRRRVESTAASRVSKRWSLSSGRRSVTFVARAGPGCSESTIATRSWPAAETWSSSSLPRYSTTSALARIVAAVRIGVAEVEVLGAEPGDERLARCTDDRARGAAARGSWRPAPRRVVASPDPATVTSMKFIAGLPMKPATNRLIGVVVELLRRADLLEQALAHDRDPAAHRHRLDLVVGDVDDRRAEALVEAGDLGAGLDAQLGVEVGERLVHEEDGRLADDGPAERDALALAAGELLRLAVEVALEVEDRRPLP